MFSKPWLSRIFSNAKQEWLKCPGSHMKQWTLWCISFRHMILCLSQVIHNTDDSHANTQVCDIPYSLMTFPNHVRVWPIVLYRECKSTLCAKTNSQIYANESHNYIRIVQLNAKSPVIMRLTTHLNPIEIHPVYQLILGLTEIDTFFPLTR